MGYVDSTGQHGEVKEEKKETKPLKAEQGGEVNFGLTQEEIDLVPLKQYFGIEGPDTGWGEKLKFILGWAMKKGIKTKEDLFTELRKIEMRLGEPNLGETRENRLYRYLKLDAQLTNLFKEMKAMEGK